jgi:type VI secretion system secreted protein Hcp
VPYFLKIDGIAGESTDAKHKGEIEVESFSFGVSQSVSAAGGAGGGAGKPTFEDLNVVTRFGKAGPRLLQACATGEHLRSAVLTGRRDGQAQFAFVTLTLSDVLVRAYQSAAPTAEVIPSDAFALAFAKLQIEHKAQKADGSAGESTVAGFDVRRNTKL